MLLALWYVAITHTNHSAVFTGLIILLNVLTMRLHMKTFNAWFYRDHWLGHNSELAFVYLHGPHHDAIPTGVNHPYLKLEPYGIGMNATAIELSEATRKHTRFISDAILNPIDLDQQLNGFQWDNPSHARFMELFDRYQS